MPIVPRFVGQPDPSQAPEQNWAHGIQQAALAGEQLRRMGLEATLSKERLAMDKERQGLAMRQGEQGLEIGKQNLELGRQNIAANQRQFDAADDKGRIAEWQMQRGGSIQDQYGGAGIGSEPIPDGFSGPRPMTKDDLDRLEVLGAQEMMNQIQTPEGKDLFARTFKEGLKERQIQLGFEQTQGKLQNLLLGVSRMPSAATFQPMLETLAISLDQLSNPGLEADKRAAAVDGLSQKILDVEKLIYNEDLRIQRYDATLATAASKRDALPVGHPSRALFEGIVTELQMNPQANPDSYATRMGAAEVNLVEDPVTKGYMKPEVLSELQLKRDAQTQQLTIAKMRFDQGGVISPFEASKMARSSYESQYHIDKETGQMVWDVEHPMSEQEFMDLYMSRYGKRRDAGPQSANPYAVDVEGELGGGGQQQGGQQQGGQPTGEKPPGDTTPEPPKPLDAATLKRRIEDWKTVGLVPQERIAAAEKELAALEAETANKKRVKTRYANVNPRDLDLQRRKAMMSGDTEKVKSIEEYYAAEEGPRAKEINYFKSLSDEDFSSLILAPTRQVKEPRGRMGSRG